MVDDATPESASSKDSQSPRKRQARRDPDEVKARILNSALTAFSNYGFEGASIRQIARDAHTSLPLLLYHFGSKEDLWKRMMEYVLQDVRHRFIPDEREDLPASERLRRYIADTVRQFANTPSLHRLMTLEGHNITDRLLWIFEHNTKDSMRYITRLIIDGQKEGKVRMVDPARLRFAINAMAAVPFVVSAEYQLLTNKNPFSTDEVEGTIALINQFVFVS
ncbi:TetR family transcriptional regulator [Sphingobium phenoxybenzoativorans]|uniref:TetR family transcriptional regulator n=1 Tax=Sphingobium phenoxybenzoativorans TaxID=1592790 RepID=A0A975Q3L4_9SPHN|nr:TetR/AcrR family transcriptional regulator [Sphingobium phenoxybenzoativorans]QUT07856.1 TetR family transcriptional regulator [Sphingobium phenoxybenzoativorans]